MSWAVVERKIGRAGGVKRRQAKQREWDRKYGDGNWQVGYVVDGAFVSQDDAFDQIYKASYVAHFDAHPEDLQALVDTAKVLRNPHAEATTGVDLQVPAIMEILSERGLSLQGDVVMDIGTWQNERSHPLSVKLSPLQVACVLKPQWTLEKFWQEKKVLATWRD
ncbi:MAG: hypothetical protein ACE366_18515 [Bradymonadia bacterium]